MTAIQSKSLAILGMSYPKSMTFLLGDTAAESKRPLGVNASLSSLIQAEKDSLSESGPLLQSTCLEINENGDKSWSCQIFFFTIFTQQEIATLYCLNF